MIMLMPPGLNPQRNITHIVPSLAASLGAPMPNALQLPAAASAVLLLVDGLGLEQLTQYSAHAPFLRRVLKNQTAEQTEMSTIYPSTTAAALSSLGTGLTPGQHGIVGYDVYDPERHKVINQLGGWDERTDPESWQPKPTLFEQLNVQRTQGIHTIRPMTVSLPAFEHSALTRASLQGPAFVGKQDLGKRFVQASALTHQPGALVYLYVNELDKVGHKYGPGSQQWLETLEEIDAQARRMVLKLPASTLAAVTSDHGMIEIREEERIDYAAYGELIEHIEHTAGEPRMVQLHFKANATEHQRRDTVTAWKQRFGDAAWVLTRQQAIASGWFGPVSSRVEPRIGDVLVSGYKPIALYDSRRAAPHSFAMVGHHGAPTPGEVRVPWLVVKTP